MILQEVVVLDSGCPITIYKWHTNGTLEGTLAQTCWEAKPNRLTSKQLQPCGMAAILNHLQVGHGGSKIAVSRGYLLNFVCFPDITQIEATIDKKTL